MLRGFTGLLVLVGLLVFLTQPVLSQTPAEKDGDVKKQADKTEKDKTEKKEGEEPTIKNPLVAIPMLLVLLLGMLLMGVGTFWKNIAELISHFRSGVNTEGGQKLALIGALMALGSAAIIYYFG